MGVLPPASALFTMHSSPGLETSAVHAKGLVGNCKLNHKDKNLGAEVEVNVSSAGDAGSTNAKLTFTNLFAGGKVAVSADANPNAKVETTYGKDFFAGTLTLGSNFAGKNKLDASGAIGYDDVAVGGAVSCCLASGAVKDYNVGAEYSQKDFVASLVTSNQGNDITTSFFQKVSGGFSLGTKLNIEESGNRTLTVGSDYALDKSTTIKKSLSSNGILNVAVSHVLANPALKLNVAAQFDALGGDISKANKMGVCVTMGDF